MKLFKKRGGDVEIGGNMRVRKGNENNDARSGTLASCLFGMFLMIVGVACMFGNFIHVGHHDRFWLNFMISSVSLILAFRLLLPFYLALLKYPSYSIPVELQDLI
uniref:Uncharacterized protein n=1 Tax=Timspurckia oligopyrenoides TaxID=708627 RepID=A0A7S0ZF49_9RHOD|mmetsp:Transcript_2930/g.5147  ORF Transcript_2930/g.5147 Transcript_2930/m.5147 type:complete len:105 (+) Transcript_2930:68-382(+)